MIEICGDDSKKINERNPTDPTDLPPEYCRYKDEGCELAESCLNCPFPYCLYDEPRGKQRWLKQVRDREIKKLFDKGSATRELGVVFGLSRRTIQRALKNKSVTDRKKIKRIKKGDSRVYE